MKVIYPPSKRAREYSPLALNIYSGCDHGCLYCYVPKILHKTREQFLQVHERKNLLKSAESDAKELSKNSSQVLLCFTGDPYCRFNNKAQLTSKVLKILLNYQIPVSILTKGGSRCLQDMDLFKRFNGTIKVGATLTILDTEKSKEIEPGSSLPDERIKTLKILHDNNIKTWVSIEPVIYPEQSLKLIELSLPYVDQYKIGKLNHFRDHEKRIDWHKFLKSVLTILRSANKPFYVKKDLAEFRGDIYLTEDETNMNILNLKKKDQLILF